MSKFYTFLKGIAATLLVFLAPATALADYDATLGEAVTDLSQLSADKTYAIYNDHFTTYMCYDASASTSAVWAAGMTGDASHGLTFTPPAYDATAPAMAWLVSYKDGKLYIKNVDNGKYVKTQADNPGAYFDKEESALEVVDLGDGKFAFHSSTDGSQDFACCAPQLGAYGCPIGWWESSDAGAAWQFIENPNVAVPVDAAPAALAGTYTVTTGAWSTSDADNFSVDNYPTTYTATITVDATGHALMKGFVGNPRKMVLNLETGVSTITDSTYVGTWSEANQTLTFTYPEGGYYMMNDEDYCNWSLKAPFTLKATLADGKYTLATTDDVSFLVNSAGYVATVAGVTFAPEGGSSTPDPVVPDLPSDINSEIALADLAGEYTAVVGSYSLDETDAYYSDTKSAFETSAARTTFTAKVTVNEDGTAGLEGFIGDYNNKVDLGQYNVIALPGVWDNDAKTLTFAPKDVKNDYFKDEDGNKWRFNLTEPLVFKASINVGTAHYELKADTLKFRFSTRTLTANTPATANDVVFTSKFEYVVPVVEPDPVPEAMAGTYKVTALKYLVDDESFEVPEGPTTTYATLTVKDGVALLSTLIGTASQSSMDDEFNVTSKDTAYVGKYYAENGNIEFNVPDGFDVTVPGADGYWKLQANIIFKVSQNEDGLYTFTDGSAAYKIDDEATVNVLGIECQQLAPVSFTEEDLIGKWNFAYEVLDEEADEEDTYISKTSTFEIKKADDGSLYMTNFLGTDTTEYPLTVTATGISIKSYNDSSTGDIFNGSMSAFAPVDFLMQDASTMTLVSSCIYYSAEEGEVYAIIKTGAVATKAAEEETFDPAPADLAGRYTIATGAWTSDNEEEFPGSGIATSYKGKITVDAEGKVLMTGLVGTPQSSSYDPETWEMTYTDSAYVGRYNAAEQTITFTFPASSDTQYWDIYDENSWQSYVCSKPFTVKVAKTDAGTYVLTADGSIDFNVSETYNVSCAGAVFTQLKSYTMTADELVGKWQMKYAATDAYGEPTGEEAKTTFTIKKADDGNLVLTELAGSSEELPITLSSTGFSLPYTYSLVGDEMDGYYLMISGSTSTASDVEFYFSGDDTFTLDTPFMFCNQANPEGVLIPAATVATRFVPELGEAVTSLDELSNETAYVIYNPNDVVYAVYDEAHADNIWAANVPGQTEFSSAAVDFDATADASSWMVVKKGDKLVIYNLGAHKYLTTASDASACQFSDDITLLSVVELGDGKFAFTSHEDNELSFFCSAAAFPERLMTTWSSDDHGCAWQFIANPNVAADAEIAGTITEINTVIGNASAPAAIYTLGGVRLNATDPTKLQRGIYIVNGRKVIVK